MSLGQRDEETRWARAMSLASINGNLLAAGLGAAHIFFNEHVRNGLSEGQRVKAIDYHRVQSDNVARSILTCSGE